MNHLPSRETIESWREFTPTAGARPKARYQASQGVCAALLIESGIPVISQRDFKTLYYIKRKLQSQLPHRDDLQDHHESEWYRNYFGVPN